MRAQDDPAYLTPLLQALKQRQRELPSRVFASGLEAAAYLARNEEKKDAVREYLIEHLNDPRKSVMKSAIGALGTLGDPKAIPVLETFAAASVESPERSAAETAVAVLRADRKPVDDFKEMRSEVMDLQKANRRLRHDLDDLKNEIAARNPAAPLPVKKQKTSPRD